MRNTFFAINGHVASMSIVTSDNGTFFISYSAPVPVVVLTVTAQAGRINVPPIVCGFISFAVISASK
jgi:hypothetical protein